MKSNIAELFSEMFPRYKAKRDICVDDMVNEAYQKIVFIEEPEPGELLKRDIKHQFEVYLNSCDCYSFKKNHFISLDAAGIQDLQTMDDSFANDIKGRQATLNRIKQRETEVGQMCMKFDEESKDFQDYVEQKSILEIISAVNT